MSEPPHLLAFHGVRPLPFAFTNPSYAFPSTCHIVAERRHFSLRYRAWCRFESDGRHGKLVGFPSVEDWALNSTCPTFLAMVKLCQRVFFSSPIVASAGPALPAMRFVCQCSRHPRRHPRLHKLLHFSPRSGKCKLSLTSAPSAGHVSDFEGQT